MSLEPVIDGSLSLKVMATIPLNPTCPIVSYDGQIFLCTDNGKYVIGGVKYSIVPIRQLNAVGMNPFFEMDSVDQDLGEFMKLIEEGSSDWSEAVRRVLPEVAFEELVCVHLLMVAEPFRGLDIGLKCLAMLPRILGGAALYALLIKEREFVEVGEMELPLDDAASLRALAAYFSKAGFVRIPGTRCMGFDGQLVSPLIERQGYWNLVNVPLTAAMEVYKVPETGSNNSE